MPLLLSRFIVFYSVCGLQGVKSSAFSMGPYRSEAFSSYFIVLAGCKAKILGVFSGTLSLGGGFIVFYIVCGMQGVKSLAFSMETYRWYAVLYCFILFAGCKA
jgi:hypothetical protein